MRVVMKRVRKLLRSFQVVESVSRERGDKLATRVGGERGERHFGQPQNVENCVGR
jgi:hypothetical protein